MPAQAKSTESYCLCSPSASLRLLDAALPETSAGSALACLEELDQRENWDLWPGMGEKHSGEIRGLGAVIAWPVTAVAEKQLLGVVGPHYPH